MQSCDILAAVSLGGIVGAIILVAFMLWHYLDMWKRLDRALTEKSKREFQDECRRANLRAWGRLGAQITNAKRKGAEDV